MRERAYAKINLCLDVAGIREDGYHDLKMIMVPIDFYDVLDMHTADETSLSLNRSFLPVDEKNTIIKAIRIMQRKYNLHSEYACVLQKHIPTRAGLAGGSSDAAAAIRMIDRIERLHLSAAELLATGKEVGADVPFCILSRPAYVEGIGEKITPFECHTDFNLLLVKPRKGVSTKEAFALVDKRETVHPDCMKMRNALMHNDYQGIVDSLGNSMEDAAIEIVQDIRHVKEELKDKGFDGVLMSGSGSTVFGITRDKDLAVRAMDEMKKQKYFVRLTKVMNG